MHGALKPSSVLVPPPTTQQHSVTATTVSNAGRSMHPQGAPAAAFGQSQNAFPNMNAAHSHPNAQQNVFSVGGFNIGTIPASNHPVANINQTNAGGPQLHTAPKNIFSSFQSSAGHQQNQNTLPPVSQALPPTTPQSHQHSSTAGSTSSSNSSTPTLEIAADKPQSNGTSEEKPSPTESEPPPGNRVPTQTLQPAQVPQLQTSPQQLDKAKPSVTNPVHDQKVPPTDDASKPSEETTKTAAVATPAPVPFEAPVQNEKKDVKEAPTTRGSPDVAHQKSPEITKTRESGDKSNENTPTPTQRVEETQSSTEEKVPNTTTDEASKKSENAEYDDRLEKEVEPIEETTADGDKDDEEMQASDPLEDAEDPLHIPATKESLPTPTSPPKQTTPSTSGSPPRSARKAKTVAKAAVEPKTPVAGSSTLHRSPSTGGKAKRQRMRTQHYQSPLPEVEIVTKMTSLTPRSRGGEDKLIYFYKNEFLAVRNAEGGFYICQAVQNVYKSSQKIKIRWLSQDKDDKTGEIYTPDFYDLTDFDCILTSLELSRVEKGKFRLKQAEKERTESILKRCIAVEKGEITEPSVSEEHPDGLDLSLYKKEEQVMKKKRQAKKRKRPTSKSPAKKEAATKKTPEAAKVKKPNPKPTEKKPQAPPKKTAAPPAAKKAVPSVDQKKSASGGGKAASKTKRKVGKTNPVVDQKKAKVLAKIGRKTAVAASAVTNTASKSSAGKGKVTKASIKPTPSTSKAPTKPTVVKTSSKKTKRSSKK